MTSVQPDPEMTRSGAGEWRNRGRDGGTQGWRERAGKDYGLEGTTVGWLGVRAGAAAAGLGGG